jgi:hypothetical protein
MILPLSDNIKAAVLATAKLILYQHRLQPHSTVQEAAEDVVNAAASQRTFKKAQKKLERPLPSSSTFLISLKEL